MIKMLYRFFKDLKIICYSFDMLQLLGEIDELARGSCKYGDGNLDAEKIRETIRESIPIDNLQY